MRLYAFAALLALPFLGLEAGTANANYYCCGQGFDDFGHTRSFYVPQDAVLFSCDGYFCRTGITLNGGTYINAGCRNGWCEIRSLPLRNAWVLRNCLRSNGYVPYGNDNGNDNDNDNGGGDDR